MKVRTGMPFVIIVKKIESDDAKHNKITRGVARTVVMCRHLNETVGFTEAQSDEWG